ncbi:MAG TPA: glycosyl transferase [Desulfobulbaceae bacterium]|nr:glycosyl transferase [Desulfobulbaceae bacterium]
MDKTVSLIIPVKYPNQFLQQCLESIACCSPPPLEVIVVLDGGTDQAAPETGLKNLRTVMLPETCGPSRARNIGALNASGDILLFVDSDVILPPDIITRINRGFTAAEPPDAVFGSYDDKPPAQDTVSQYKNLLNHYVHQTSNPNAFTFWTGCGAILRSRFLEAKGFCEDYRQPSIEDIELGYRLKKAGATILLDKTIQVTHLKHWSLSVLLRTDFFQRAIPWSQLIFRSGSMNNDMNINMTGRLSVLLSWLIVLMLCLAPVNFYFAVGSAFSFTLFLFMNRDIFLFFSRKRGWWFMTRTIPLHFLYFLSSGLAFGMVLVQHLLRGIPGSERNKTAAAG